MDKYEGKTKVNPLHQPPVLQIIFQHMDIQSLKTARQVCKIWYKTSAGDFGKRTTITIKDNCFYKEYKTLKFPLRNIRVNSISYLEQKMFGNVSRSISSLHFPVDIGPATGLGEYKCCPFQWSTIHSILIRCENLKDFSVVLKGCTHIPPHAIDYSDENARDTASILCTYREKYKNITTLRISLTHKASLANEFIKRMPSINFIDISVGGQIFLDKIMEILVTLRKGGYLKNLNKIKIQGTKDENCRFGDRHLSNLISMNLTGLISIEIKEIALRNSGSNILEENQLSPFLFFELFSQCSKTLQFFSLNNGKTNRLPIFKFPVMENLIYLEIYLLLIPDWPRLLLRTNILEQFPKIKKIVVCQRYCKNPDFIGGENRNSGINYWNTFDLECKTNSGSSKPFHELHFKVHNLLFSSKRMFVYEEMRSIFPTLRSLRTTIQGYYTLLSLLTVMRWTLVEKIDIHVLCLKRFAANTQIHLCHCDDHSPEFERLDFVCRFKKDIKDFQAMVGNLQFSNLQSLSITSGGCELMHDALSFPKPWLATFLKDAKMLTTLQLNGKNTMNK